MAKNQFPFVLIHGGWAGAWQWEHVVPLLEARGHTCLVPHLTGLGDKRGLLTPEIDLSTHIADCIDSLSALEEERFFLVGFSYGGMVATGVAAALPERIKTLIYLDAFVPAPGDSLFDLFGPRIAKNITAIAEGFGDGWKVPYFNATDPRLADQPLATTRQPLDFQSDLFETVDPVYIECTGKDPDWSFTSALRRTADGRRRAGWRVYEIGSDHFPMISRPDELVDLLVRIAGGR